MTQIKISEGYNQVMPYLIIERAADFIDFTKTVFNAEEKQRMMRDEATVMHAEISFGSQVVMLADATEQFQVQTAGLFIYVDNCDEVFKKALDNGATQLMAPANQNYGRSGGVKDPFGITWWITSV